MPSLNGFTNGRRDTGGQSVLDVDIYDQTPLSSISQTIPDSGVDISKLSVLNRGQTAYDTGIGWWLGMMNGIPKFSLGNSAGNKLTWDGTTLSVPGVSSLGGFSIGTDYIIDSADSFGLSSTITGGDDIRFWAGGLFVNRATAPLRIYESGKIVATNVEATGTMNATGGYIGTTTALVYESQGISVGSTGHIRGNQTDYHTGSGFFLGRSGGQYKFSIGDPTTTYLTWDGSNLTIKGGIIGSPISIGVLDSDSANKIMNTILHRTSVNAEAISFPARTASGWFQFKLPASFTTTYDILLDMSFENQVGGGNIRWKLEYWVVTTGGDMTPTTSPTYTTYETMAANASTELLKNITTTTLKVRKEDLVAQGDMIVCKLTRLGVDALDTNSGATYITNLTCTQYG